MFRTASLCLLSLLSAPALLFSQDIPDEEDLFILPTLTVTDQRDGTAPVISIHDLYGREKDPILPRIFFDHPGDWKIPDRYHQFADRSAAADYCDTNSVMHSLNYRLYRVSNKYSEVLDIFGYRLRTSPTTSINLRCGYSWEPGEDEMVARERAEVVRDYLVTIWEIEPHRISILEPERMCDSTDHLLQQEEARCVVIETLSWDLIRPVSYHSIIRFIDPPPLRITLQPNLSPDQIDSIEIVMMVADTLAGRIHIAGHPDSLTYEALALWVHDHQRFASISELTVEARVMTRDGSTRRSNVVIIPVESRSLAGEDSDSVMRARSTYEHVLPFFSFRDSVLSPLQRMLFDDIFKGYADSGRIVVAIDGEGEDSEFMRFDRDYSEPFHRQRHRWVQRDRERRALNRMTMGRIYYPYYYSEDEYDDLVTYAWASDSLFLDIEDLSGIGVRDTGRHLNYDLFLGRASTVASRILDTLGIPVINEEWTTEHTWIEFRNARHSRYFFYPETRWYGRRVQIAVYVGRYAEHLERDYLWDERVEKARINGEVIEVEIDGKKGIFDPKTRSISVPSDRSDE